MSTENKRPPSQLRDDVTEELAEALNVGVDDIYWPGPGRHLTVVPPAQVAQETIQLPTYGTPTREDVPYLVDQFEKKVRHIRDLLEYELETDEDRDEMATQLRRLRAQEKARSILRTSAAAAWEVVDLSSVDDEPEMPTVGLRSDGAGVFYREKVNGVFGDSEAGKTWFVLYTSAHVLRNGGEVVYVDYEDSPRGIKSRLRLLGIGNDAMSRFHYVRPAGVFTENVFAMLEPHLDEADLVVIDATTEALAAEGLSSNSDVDVATFYNGLPKRAAARGPAVVLIDHVVKATDGKGQQSGSQHKKAGIDGVSYRIEPKRLFAPGQGGESLVLVGKDRPGGVREHSVFGGAQQRFAVFRMNEVGTTSLDVAEAATTRVDMRAAKNDMLAGELALLFEKHGPKLSQRKAINELRNQGHHFNDKDVRQAVRERAGADSNGEAY